METHILAVRFFEQEFAIHRDTERENAVIRQLARRGITCYTRALRDD